KMDAVAAIHTVNQRAHGAVAGDQLRAGWIAEVIKVGFERSVGVTDEVARYAGDILTVGRQEEHLERRDGVESDVKEPWPLAQVKAANQLVVQRERRVDHVLVHKGQIEFGPGDLVRQEGKANPGLRRAGGQ